MPWCNSHASARVIATIASNTGITRGTMHHVSGLEGRSVENEAGRFHRIVNPTK